jgi:molybdenum cofactor guanylyltransferase
MKTDKAYLEICGETFLERSARILASVCDGQVKIILNRSQIAPENYECIYDVYAERGALGGIHCALENCRGEYAIILAVDLPLVSGSAIEKLKRIALESDGFSAVVPIQADGRLQPLCAVYHARDCLPVAEKLLRQTDSSSMREFLELLPTRIVEFEKASGEDLFFNVNFKTDYETLVPSYPK